MNKFLQKVKNHILYAGLTKEEFDTIRIDVRESNYKAWRLLSILLSVIFLVLFILSMVSSLFAVQKWVYLSCLITNLIMVLIINKFHGENYDHVNIYTLICCATIFVAGIMLGTYNSPDENAATIFVLMIAVPIINTNKPLRLNILIVLATALFIGAEFLWKNPARRTTDIQNSLIFCLVAIIVNQYMQYTRFDVLLTKKRLNDENLRMDKDLKHTLDELSTDKELLQQANEVKSTFLFNMSHDIRTPMNAITGYTAMAKKHIKDENAVSDYLFKIDVSGKQLLTLLNQVLEMSRIGAGKTTSELKTSDIMEQANAMVTIMYANAEAKGVKMECKALNLIHHKVYADEEHMNQVILNILSNAVKFNKEGGSVLYTIDEATSDIPGYGRYTFTIKDTGNGMSKEFLGKIFETFSREKNSTASGIQGTGLGMSIVKNLVEFMGGKIEIESEQDVGTTVKLIMDLMYEEEKVEEVQQVDEEQVIANKLNGLRLLLVDDNEMNREIAKDILEFDGIVVEEADDGDVAVDMVSKSEPGYYKVVLMDIQMPKMNGYDATRAIRKLPGEIANIPILAMTANAFEEDRKNAFEAGMNAHLAKPIDIDKLRDAIVKHALD